MALPSQSRLLSRSLSLSFSLSLLLAACGGGGGEGGGISGTGTGAESNISTGGNAPAPGATPNVSFGTITALGSIWVNGVEFDTTQAQVSLAGTALAASALKPGMTVRVDGSISGKTAATVVVDPPVAGRLERIVDASHWRVMGQTVQIPPETRVEGTAAPQVGDWVDVHGQVRGDGVLEAGYVLGRAGTLAPPYTVKGLVKGHDPVARTFFVGDLRVGYPASAGAAMSGSLWNGQLAVASGDSCNGSSSCDQLNARSVTPGALQVSASQLAAIEGFVTATDASGFSLANQRVTPSASTVYEGGTLADLLVGAKVQVEGPISNGVLLASRVSYRDNVRLEADVATSSAGAATLTLSGLSGVTVIGNTLTDFQGGAGLANWPAPGTHLRIRGRRAANNQVIATELLSRSADSRVVLQAPLDSFVPTTSVTLLGIVVNTGSVPDAAFTLHGSVLGRAGLYGRLNAGSQVKARGSRSGGVVTWSEIELEN